MEEGEQWERVAGAAVEWHRVEWEWRAGVELRRHTADRAGVRLGQLLQCWLAPAASLGLGRTRCGGAGVLVLFWRWCWCWC